MANLNIRVDDELKKQAEYVFSELGLNMSTAMTMFLKQTVRKGGIPFDLTISDPFYSLENQNHLINSISEYESNKNESVKKTFEELEVLGNE